MASFQTTGKNRKQAEMSTETNKECIGVCFFLLYKIMSRINLGQVRVYHTKQTRQHYVWKLEFDMATTHCASLLNERYYDAFSTTTNLNNKIFVCSLSGKSYMTGYGMRLLRNDRASLHRNPQEC